MIFNLIFKKLETKNWPHEIIDFLYRNYSETWTELNKFFYTKLKLEKHNTTHKDKVRELLDQLEEKGYLKWIANKMNDKNQSIDSNYRETFRNITNDGLDAARVEARLTLEGLDYAIELRRERQKHKIYKWATPLGTAFAFLAFTISLMTFLRGRDEKCPLQPIQLQLPTEIAIDTLSLRNVHIQALHYYKDIETSLTKFDTISLKTIKAEQKSN